jgi:type II secretory pathway component PulC
VYAAVSPAIDAAPASRTRIPEVEEGQSGTRPWSHYEIIGQRNLLRSASEAPIVRAPAQEIEESKLRMKLHGTITGDGNSVATLEDLSTHERFYVRPGDLVGGATVEWIERRKVVIMNQGKREAITMDDEVAPTPRARPRAARASTRSRPVRNPAQQAQRVRERLLDRLPRRARGGAINPAGGVANLMEQATFRPVFDEQGEVEGLLVEDLRPGSGLADAGLSNGAVCVALNGVMLSNLQSLEPASRSRPGQQNCLTCRNEDDVEQSYCL